MFKPRALMLLIVTILIMTGLTSAVFAAHPHNGTGPDICTSTDVIYLHSAYNTVEPFAAHKISSGYCNKTLEISWHIKKCADCAFLYPGEHPLACRIIHDKCPTEYLSPCRRIS